MEKIIITCNAEYLSYEFPKRKWYQLFQPDRIALMRLDFAREDSLRADILLRILENFILCTEMNCMSLCLRIINRFMKRWSML